MKSQNNKRSRGHRGNGRRSGFHGRGTTFESNGPEGKIRGTAFQVIEKYQALARDAQSSGDRIAAENFYQHAEHYHRVVAANGWDQRNQQRAGPQHGGPQPPADQQQSADQPQSEPARQPEGQSEAPIVAEEATAGSAGEQPQPS